MLKFSVPQNIIVDYGGVSRLGSYAAELKMTNVLIIADPFLADAPLAKQATDSLDEAGIKHVMFSDVKPNPTAVCVEEGEAAFKKAGCDSIIAIGGGSSLDVAKAIGVVVKYGGEIGDYEGMNNVPGPIVPFIAIPTTAGTGSEVTSFSVITDEARNYKLTVGSKLLLPAYAILDPGVLATVPARVAAACGTDAMVHAIESFTNTVDSTFSGMYSLEALRLIGKYFKRFYARRDDAEAARGMMVAATMAGIAFEATRLGLVHAMSHPISAFFHVAHGEANGLLLPSILEFNALADKGQYELMHEALFPDVEYYEPADFINEIRALLAEIGIPDSLEAANVDREAFLAVVDQMTEDALKSGNVAVNPRAVTPNDVKALYKAL
ncbi:iron-containing alcohol dehydrogenase [Bifidobacterium simiarum]|uniref:Alcohol dehydrogenase n=1 Tax=Bifidobacterium simiarum TaxID=2045441 RepID=A0A2M9HFI6_9BIFI|nr:iron-containing alcohol dehydrogenase [Bifidobacterium simiarum]MBT1166478.1 iron-containing alcohol dehydrogenase [Bifidobacterium simiarum]PJM75571.1 alcohol dehydrogenase [Bifidobacterium simiarum]